MNDVPSIDEAIARLERTLVREGSSREQSLVLEEPPHDAPWPADVDVHADARAWLSWRAVPWPSFLLLPSEGTETTFEHRLLANVGDEPWNRLRDSALGAGRPELVPISEDLLSDSGDGSVWSAVWNDDGVLTFERIADSLPELLVRIERRYAALASSPWRGMRIAPTTTGLRVARCFDAVDLSKFPLGTLLVTRFDAAKRFARRGTVSLKVGPDRWTYGANREWSGGALDDEIVERWADAVRSEFAAGHPHLMSNERQAKLLATESSKPGGTVHIGEWRLWARPRFDELLTRLRRALARMPELQVTLNPPATDAQLAEVERALDMKLPDDVRTFYTFANGQRERSPSLYWRYHWQPLESALASRSIWQQLRDEQFGPECWDDGSLPFLDKGDGDLIYLDLRGAVANAGAVVDLNHERPATREILFGSVAEWLECFVDGLESDLYRLDDGGVFPFSHHTRHPAGVPEVGNVTEFYLRLAESVDSSRGSSK